MISFIYFVHNIHPRLNVHLHVFYIRACRPLEQNPATFLTMTCAYLIFEKIKKQKKKKEADFLSGLHILVCICTNYRCRQITAYSGDESTASSTAEMQIVSGRLSSAVKSILISPLFAHWEQGVVILQWSKRSDVWSVWRAGVQDENSVFLRNRWLTKIFFLHKITA